VDFATGKPATDVPIKAVGRRPSWDLPNPSDSTRTTDVSPGNFHEASTRTGADGRYSLTNLPAAVYDVWAQTPAQDWKDAEWVSRGVAGVVAKATDKRTIVPELVLGPGGTIRGQLVDATNGKPLSIDGSDAELSVAFLMVDGPTQQDMLMQTVPVSPNGKFEIRTFPGKLRVFVMVNLHTDSENPQGDYRSDDSFWQTGPIYDLGHGQSVDAAFNVWPTKVLEDVRQKIERGRIAEAEGDHEESIKLFSDVLTFDPKNLAAITGRAHVFERAGSDAEAVADYTAAAELASEDPYAYWRLADLLATSSNSQLRDGTRAVELARKVVERMRRQPPNGTEVMALALLASAEAEAGNFGAAVALQREAIERSPAERHEEMRERLRLYETNRPYHRPAVDRREDDRD
jgi:hypothetical protein